MLPVNLHHQQQDEQNHRFANPSIPLILKLRGSSNTNAQQAREKLHQSSDTTQAMRLILQLWRETRWLLRRRSHPGPPSQLTWKGTTLRKRLEQRRDWTRKHRSPIRRNRFTTMHQVPQKSRSTRSPVHGTNSVGGEIDCLGRPV
jgi:hypothetical protein